MLLTGSYSRSMDDKQRVAIPKKWRDLLGEQALYAAPGTEGSVVIYPERAFLRLGQQLEGHSTPTAKDVLAFSRVFYAQAEGLEVDSQGRVRLPPTLTQLAKLDHEVVLLGVRDHMEVWDRSRWETYLSEQQQRYDEIAERAFQARGQGSDASAVGGS